MIKYLNGGLSAVGLLFIIIALGVDKLSAGSLLGAKYKLGWKTYTAPLIGKQDYPCSITTQLCDAGRQWLAFGLLSTFCHVALCVLALLRYSKDSKKKRVAFLVFSIVSAICMFAAVISWSEQGHKKAKSFDTLSLVPLKLTSSFIMGVIVLLINAAQIVIWILLDKGGGGNGGYETLD